jgi:hypothetical protein
VSHVRVAPNARRLPPLEADDSVEVGGSTFGPIERVTDVEPDPTRDQHGDFVGRRANPGLIVAGKSSVASRRRCAQCGRLIRGSSIMRHADAHLAGYL